MLANGKSAASTKMTTEHLVRTEDHWLIYLELPNLAMLNLADLVLNNNRLVLLDDETSCGHEDTSLKLLISLATRLKGQMGD